MQKRLFALLCALLLALPSVNAVGEEALYTGVVSRELSVRERMSTSAKRIDTVETYEEIAIVELGDE